MMTENMSTSDFALRADQKESFARDGYLFMPGLLDPTTLERISTAYDRAWQQGRPRVHQHKLLTHREFIDFIEYPPIIGAMRSIFGPQLQLLQYDLLHQEANAAFPQRNWHRDFFFPGDRPLSTNIIIYLDEMDDARGPTRVIPGSHRGESDPTNGKANEPHTDEMTVYANPGDAVIINSAIWHSGSRNNSPGERRTIYAYYGYWWLKRYEHDQDLPSQALVGASEQRLELLGLKMPGENLHLYDPKGTLNIK